MIKMMKTMIISAFPACGKTYLFQEQDNLTFRIGGQDQKISFKDSDSSKYEKIKDWEKNYVNEIIEHIGTVDFIFVSQHEEVLRELNNRHVPYVKVLPDNLFASEREKQLIKQQWFGRMFLRDNSFLRYDFSTWINIIKEHYDEWTSEESIDKYNPASFFLLKEDQYLQDIIADLYWKKEHNPDIYVYQKS